LEMKSCDCRPAFFENYVIENPHENKKGIGNFEDFVFQMTEYRRPVYKWGEGRFYIEHDGDKIRIFENDLSRYGEIIDVPVDKRYVYKFVDAKSDGKLISQWSNKFEYRVGEPALDNNHGLYFYYKDGLRACLNNYGSASSTVMIECEVVRLKEEGAFSDDVLRCYEVNVLRIVPKEEYKEMLDAIKEEEDTVPFKIKNPFLTIIPPLRYIFYFFTESRRISPMSEISFFIKILFVPLNYSPKEIIKPIL